MAEIEVLYLCDTKACKNCSDFCEHTSNIEHAVHRNDLDGRMFEYVYAGKNKVGFFEVRKED